MSTQLDINNIVNSVVNELGGQTKSFPNGGYPGQCTVPVAGYYIPAVIGQPAPPMYADRADGWSVQFPTELANSFTPEPYQPGKAYPKGTILIWNSPHIAIVVSHDGSNTVEVFEQNADPDGSPCHTATRVINNSFHTCTYALLPIIQPDAPIAPPAPPYTVENIPTKTIELIRDAMLWNMQDTTFPEMSSNPVAPYPKGYQETTAAIAHHQDGYDYYLVGNMSTTGFNTDDCQDYVAPAPPPVQAPVQLATAAPAVTAPNTSATFVVKTNLNGYSSPGNALASKPPVTMTFAAGVSYFVYSRLNGMMNLTTKAGTPGAWVNPTLNVVVPSPPPPVTPLPAAVVNPLPKVDNSWKSMTPLRRDRKPVEYEFQTNYTIHDLSGIRPPIPAHRGDKILIYGTFPSPTSSKRNYRPKLQADIGFQFWFGVPVTDAFGNKIIEPVEVPAATDTTYIVPNKVTIADKLYVYAKTGEKWLDGIKKHF